MKNTDFPVDTTVRVIGPNWEDKYDIKKVHD